MPVADSAIVLDKQENKYFIIYFGKMGYVYTMVSLQCLSLKVENLQGQTAGRL